MFNGDYTYRIADVTDGLSNTFYVGETSRYKNDPDGTFFYSWSNDIWWGSSVAGVSRINALASTIARPNAPVLIPDVGPDSTNFMLWWRNPACCCGWVRGDFAAGIPGSSTSVSAMARFTSSRTRSMSSVRSIRRTVS